MKELVEYIARGVVNQPEAVEVEELMDEMGVVLKLKVSPEDKGRIIGKQGKVVEAIRTLLRVMAIREEKKVRLEVVD
jgi:hypothetical protein